MSIGPTADQEAAAYAEVEAMIAAQKAGNPGAQDAPATGDDQAPAAVQVEIGTDAHGQPLVNAAQLASGVAALRERGLSDHDAAALAAGKPLTVLPEQREQAATMKARLMKDPT